MSEGLTGIGSTLVFPALWSSGLSDSVLLLTATATLHVVSPWRSSTLPSEQRPLLPGTDTYHTSAYP